MIRPIVAYGHPILRKRAKEINKDIPDLEIFFEDLWETMYHASGVGLAAPQVGESWRIFIIDTIQVYKEEEKDKGLKKLFVNPIILNRTGEDKAYEEGCLSIPKIRGDVVRKERIQMRFLDENFIEQEEEFDGLNARVIQHEYDHLEGILFTELLKPVKKRMIQRKLETIRKGKVDTDYKMIFYK